MADQVPVTPAPAIPAQPPVTEPPKADQSKMVPEADLLAVKAGKEGLEKRLKEVEDSYKSKLSDTESKLFSSEAKVKELQDKISQANLTTTELANLKAQLEAATTKSSALEARSLTLRRQMIATSYKIPLDTLNTKTMEQLDLYEEALKAVAANRGSGYAEGAGGGSGAGTKETPFERAKRVIAEHEQTRASIRVAAPPTKK